jgi:hypothetical protein
MDEVMAPGSDCTTYCMLVIFTMFRDTVPVPSSREWQSNKNYAEKRTVFVMIYKYAHKIARLYANFEIMYREDHEYSPKNLIYIYIYIYRYAFAEIPFPKSSIIRQICSCERAFAKTVTMQ